MSSVPPIRPQRLHLSGSNRAIGAALAEHAARHFGARPDPEGPESVAREALLARVAPHLVARAEGLRARFPGRDPFSLPFLMDGAPDHLPAACSVALLPARGGRGPFLLRNFDFGFLSAAALAGGPDSGVPMVAAPHLLSLAPGDGGRATCGISVFDLFGALTCGVNDAGLGVALLQHLGGAHLVGPAGALNEVEVVRVILETCATTEEAEAALAVLPRRTVWLPCRYLVADARGRGFVWSQAVGCAPRTIRDTAGFLAATNHDPDGDPAGLAREGVTANDLVSSDQRLRALCAAGRDAEPEEAATVARVVSLDPVGRPVGGTVWSAIYDLGSRCVSVRFLSGRNGDTPVMGSALHGVAA